MVADRIAAGEVVEQPASVVKELVENSLDAEASNIRISIKAGGIGEISVTDDGSGMRQEGLLLVPTRFATSKITSEKDLGSIGSFGFRGEALSSISSVSKLWISSAQRDDDGFYIDIVGGKIKGRGSIVMDKGTVTKVKDLFFNVPARRKFLKTKRSETRAIVEMAKKYATANPEVEFELIIEGKRVLSVAPEELNLRLSNVLNDAWAENPVEVFYSGQDGSNVSGYVSSIEDVASGRPTQWLFVNKRPVEDSRVKFVVGEAYEAVSRRGKAGFVLFVEVPFELVDVNVHPRKTEVKFRDSSAVYRAIFMAVKKVFSAEREEKMASPGLVRKKDVSKRAEVMIHVAQTGLVSSVKKSAPDQEENFVWNQEFPVRQVRNSYLLTNDKESIVIVDQHAAAERILYEKSLNGIKEGKIPSQALAIPVEVEVLSTDLSKGWEEQFEQLGFSVESFGENTVKIRGVPQGVDTKSAKKLFLDLLENLDAEDSAEIDELNKENAAAIACKSAIKFGDPLSDKECIKLLEDLAACENPFTCPHGRPTMKRISFESLENMFER